MKIVNCKICGKKIKRKTDERYCSSKCWKLKEKQRKAKYYLKNKDLFKRRKRKWRLNNQKRYKEYYTLYNKIWNSENSKRYRKDNKAKFFRLMKKWRKDNPEKYKAHWLASKIPIPKNKLCQICKRKKAIHRHHEDYTKPLKIKFVCGRCHIILHKKKEKQNENRKKEK